MSSPNRPRASWLSFRMRCLVTGATGFLGSHLLACLLKQGCETAVTVRESSDCWRIKPLLPQVTRIQTDIAHIAEAAAQIRDFQPEIIFHLAWTGGNSARYNDDVAQIRANLPGSLDLLQIAAEVGVKRWVGFGSAVEYGTCSGLISETLTPVPTTLYGISKYALCLMTEKICSLDKLEFAWIRPFWTFGPKDDGLRLIPMLIAKLLARERPALTPGEQLWDYLYIEDAVEAIAHLGMEPKVSGIFNLGSGEAHSVRSIVEQIRDSIDPTLQLGFGDIPYRPDQVMHLQADITKLAATTGWHPRVSLAEGLSRTIDWHRSLKP
jgi:UDP-glucose 4-epimerase